MFSLPPGRSERARSRPVARTSMAMFLDAPHANADKRTDESRQNAYVRGNCNDQVVARPARGDGSSHDRVRGLAYIISVPTPGIRREDGGVCLACSSAAVKRAVGQAESCECAKNEAGNKSEGDFS